MTRLALLRERALEAQKRCSELVRWSRGLEASTSYAAGVRVGLKLSAHFVAEGLFGPSALCLHDVRPNEACPSPDEVLEPCLPAPSLHLEPALLRDLGLELARVGVAARDPPDARRPSGRRRVATEGELDEPLEQENPRRARARVRDVADITRAGPGGRRRRRRGCGALTVLPDRYELDLGEWSCALGTYRVRLVVKKHRLTSIIGRALKSPYGRALLEAGGIAILCRRVHARPSTDEGTGGT